MTINIPYGGEVVGGGVVREVGTDVVEAVTFGKRQK